MPLDATGLTSVTAELNYLTPMAEKPFRYTFEPPEGTPWDNFRPDSRAVEIHDLRPAAHRITLDGEGFALIDAPTATRDFRDDEAALADYYAESAETLKQATGAHRVLVFDHTIRRRQPGTTDYRSGPRQPVSRIHVDQTVKAGPVRVQQLLPDEAPELLRGRVRIVNLWRPISGPLLDHPLAMADGGSLAPGDLVASDLIFPDRLGETYAVTYNPAHRWYYAPRMSVDEALLLKCYDSDETVRTRFAPHTAFADPTTPADAPPRESIELRALLFG